MHLDSAQRSRLRVRLVHLRHEAQRLLDRHRESLVVQGEHRAVGDDTDEMQGEELAGTTIALSDQAVRTIKKVDDALRAMNREEYGVCTACNGPISVQRLEALPFANLCLACAEEEEAETARRRHVPVYQQS